MKTEQKLWTERVDLPLTVVRQIGGWAFVRDGNGLVLIERIGGNHAEIIATACNEHAALVAVAEAAQKMQNHFNNGGGCDGYLLLDMQLNKSIAVLEAVRKEGK